MLTGQLASVSGRYGVWAYRELPNNQTVDMGHHMRTGTVVLVLAVHAYPAHVHAESKVLGHLDEVDEVLVLGPDHIVGWCELNALSAVTP